MNPETFKQLKGLSHCIFLSGSWEKRFVGDVGTLGPYDLLSRRQEAVVKKLYWRYRRQINALREGDRDLPRPVEPVGEVFVEEDRRDESTKQEIAKLDHKAVEALEKLAKWNRKAGRKN